jgi:hypothetical protein
MLYTNWSQVYEVYRSHHPERATVRAITFNWSEGKHLLFDFPHTVKTWELADQFLWGMAPDAPTGGAYDKTDFTVTMSNGNTYQGRFDLQPHHYGEPNLINGQMYEHLLFSAGLYKPCHMRYSHYAEYLLTFGESGANEARQWLDRCDLACMKPIPFQAFHLDDLREYLPLMDAFERERIIKAMA